MQKGISKRMLEGNVCTEDMCFVAMRSQSRAELRPRGCARPRERREPCARIVVSRAGGRSAIEKKAEETERTERKRRRG